MNRHAPVMLLVFVLVAVSVAGVAASSSLEKQPGEMPTSAHKRSVQSICCAVALDVSSRMPVKVPLLDM
jgi:hypothetical protein